MSKISSDYIKHRCTYDGIFFSGARIAVSSAAFSATTAGIGAFALEVAIMPVLTCAFAGLALTALVDLSASYISNNVDATSTPSYGA